MEATRRNSHESMSGQAAIAGVEIELPQATLDNFQLAAEFKNWTPEKILAKTGIRQRHIAGPDECASDLAVGAAKKLLARNYCPCHEIDYLIYCTQSPDYLLPTTACLIQERLELSNTCAALDFNLGCSGYIYGLGLAKALIESGQAHSVLFLTADTYSKFINPKDQSVRTLFGDAGTATLIRAGVGPGKLLGPFIYGTDGRGKNNLILPTRGLKQNFVSGAELVTDKAGNSRTINDLFMNGPEIFAFSLKVVPASVHRLVEMAGLSLDQIDLFVFHQANLFMLEQLRTKLALPLERFCIEMEDVGNTVSCTIPIALSRMIAAKKLNPGALVMLVGFGVGYSWGATLVRWESAPSAELLGAANAS
jgi:3-oxoacyl-[acyl-carrier-protein] synthase III